MISHSRTPFAAAVLSLLAALMPGCTSCSGSDNNEQPANAPRPGETPQLRGLQKVRMARPGMLPLQADGGAQAAPTVSAAQGALPSTKDGGS